MKQRDYKVWVYKGQEFEGPSEQYYGFVYVIVNKTNQKQYIGKKLFWHQKTRQVKGKKKRYLAESDWRKYFGSSKDLLQDIQTLGEENFSREILHLCNSKGDCSYYEAREQFLRDVLLIPEMFYNDWIIVKVHRKHLHANKLRTSIQRSD